MNRLWFVTIVAVLVVAGGYYLYETNQPGSLVLRFVAFVEDESLVFNQVRYGNPGGVGEFEIRDFRFFLSNIRLVSGSEEYSVPESYHLARFDGDTQIYGSPKVHVGPELAEGAPGGPVTGAFPGFSLGVLVMGQGPVEARGKRAVFSKARWARLCVRGAGSFHRACPFVTSGPRGALLHLPRVQLVKSRCPYDLRCTCVILQPERWGPNSQTLAPLRVRAHRGDHAL